jgi:hypothetical protein
MRHKIDIEFGISWFFTDHIGLSESLSYLALIVQKRAHTAQDRHRIWDTSGSLRTILDYRKASAIWLSFALIISAARALQRIPERAAVPHTRQVVDRTRLVLFDRETLTAVAVAVVAVLVVGHVDCRGSGSLAIRDLAMARLPPVRA